MPHVKVMGVLLHDLCHDEIDSLAYIQTLDQYIMAHLPQELFLKPQHQGRLIALGRTVVCAQ